MRETNRTTLISLKATRKAVAIATEVNNPHLEMPAPLAQVPTSAVPAEADNPTMTDDQARKIFMIELDDRWAIHDRNKKLIPVIIIGFGLLALAIYYFEKLRTG